MSGLPHKRARSEAAQSSSSFVALTDVNEYSHPKFRAMSDLWRAGELCDFTVKVETSEFICHKLVLASSSAYFRGLLPGDRFADSHVHELNGMQAAIFVYVLTFLYDGECSVAVDALLPMLEAAVFLQMESLQQVVAAALMQHFSATNCIIAWNFAERAGLGELQSAAKAHALDHFEDVAAMEAFADNLRREMLVELLASDKLDANEEVVFKALVAWLRAQKAADREADAVAGLLQHVRFALMKPAFISEVVEQEPLMNSVPAFKVLSQAMKEGNFGMKTPRTTLRIGMGGSLDPLATVEHAVEIAMIVPANVSKETRKVQFIVNGTKYTAVLPGWLKVGDTFRARVPVTPAVSAAGRPRSSL